MLMESRLGKHYIGAVQTGKHWLLLNSNGIALRAVHGESAAWTPKYVALSAFKQEALGH